MSFCRMKVLLAVCVSVGCTVVGYGYSWDASSGLFPNQVNANMFYRTNGGAPAPILSGGVLTLETDVLTQSSAYFDQSIFVPQNFEIDATVRYVSETTTGPDRSAAGIYFDTQAEVGTVLFIGPTSVYTINNGSGVRQQATVNTTNFHDYRITFTGTAAGNSFTVYQDSVPLFTDTLQADPSNHPPAQIGFGDSTSGASGTSEWKSFSYNAVEVPEPSVMGIFAAGLGGVALLRRRRSPRLASA